MFYPDMAFDSWLTIGLDGPPSENEGEPLTIGNSNNNWETNFEAGGDVVMADAIGGSVFILNAPNITNNISGEDHRILLGQFTTDGELEGQVNVQMFTQGIINPSDRMTIPFSGVGEHPATLLEPCADAWMRRLAITIRWPIVTTAAALPWTQKFPSWTYFPPDDTIACDEMMPTIDETMPIASDDCAGVDVVWVGDGPFDYPFGCLQSYTCPRVYRATDGAGQTLLDTVIITVLDTVAPQFFFPTEQVLSVNEFDGEAVPAAEAFVLDDCDTGAEYDVTESSTDMGNGQMVIERIYSTWDGCGNTREFHQTITGLKWCRDAPMPQRAITTPRRMKMTVLAFTPRKDWIARGIVWWTRMAMGIAIRRLWDAQMSLLAITWQRPPRRMVLVITVPVRKKRHRGTVWTWRRCWRIQTLDCWRA